MNDLTLNWKRISKGLPRAKNSSRLNNKRLTVTLLLPDITGSFDLEETSNSVSHIIFSLHYLTVEIGVLLVVVILVGRVAFSRCFIILG